MASLREKPPGSGIWYVYWKEGRRQRSKKIGAKRLAQKWKAALEARQATGDLLPLQPRNITFSDFADVYRGLHVATLAETTQERFGHSVKHLKKAFSSSHLSSISSQDIQAYHSTRRRDGAAPATIDKELRTLRAMLRKAVEWGQLRESPKIQTVRLEEKHRDFLTMDQLEQLVAECDYPLKAFVALYAYAGLRASEIRALEWKDVDFKRDELVIRRSKGRRSDRLPILEQLRDILQAAPRQGDRVMSGRIGRDVRNGFKGALDRAGLPRIRPHDLRHSFVSNLFIAGANLREVQELARHKDIRTTMRYAHLAPGRLRAAINSLKKED